MSKQLMGHLTTLGAHSAVAAISERPNYNPSTHTSIKALATDNVIDTEECIELASLISSMGREMGMSPDDMNTLLFGPDDTDDEDGDEDGLESEEDGDVEESEDETDPATKNTEAELVR